MSAENHDAWSTLLDELEASARTGGESADGSATWSPPAGIGPCPAALADRAREVHAKLGASIAAVGAARTQNRQHAGALDRVAAARTIPHRPVYLDIRG